MSMADRGWRDSTENYADGYSREFNTAASLVTALHTDSTIQTIAIYSIDYSAFAVGSSGQIVIQDGSASADFGSDTTMHTISWASGGSSLAYNASFPRGLVFNKGLTMRATGCTGDINITYKFRY